jgi:hypothetical protein
MKKFILGGLVAVAVGLGIFAAVPGQAHADDSAMMTLSEVNYAQKYGKGVICPTFESFPSTSEPLGIGASVMKDGFTAREAGHIVAYAVYSYCPQDFPTLMRIVNTADQQPQLNYAT